MINTKYEMTANFNGLREEKQNLLRGTGKFYKLLVEFNVNMACSLRFVLHVASVVQAM